MALSRDLTRFFRVYRQLLLLLQFSVLVIDKNVRFASAHRFDVNNTLGSSLSAECFDPDSGGSTARSPDATIVSPGSVLTILVDDVSMSRTCSFSWLGTAKVTQIVVWSRNSCDTCSWKVDSTGFSRKQYDGGFQKTFPWRSTCFSSYN
ncbi:unnamed protein product [Calypogeia fissa]